ncbi:MAG TPA: ATP-dependent RecD-like DNA helicase, partial [Syntrophorhabdaceae bacterium]|nr:ATP-dependent RecD-like DNA helicase [Syntrophorhabdaceae bacterium]
MNSVTEQIKGQLERITFFNEENNYAIAKVRLEGGGLVTVVGTIHSTTPGEMLKLTGQWTRHQKYGEQFKIETCETVMPATVQGIERYLGSGMIRGIGPVMAKRLVSKFKEETLSIIDNDCQRLHEVPGIGTRRIEMISTAWEEQRGIQDIMVFLQGNGVSPTYSMKIYRQYGKDSVRLVSENPYRLATEIFGIGFITADTIAAKMGVEKTAPVRIQAGVLYVLNQLSEEGNVYYPYRSLIKKCAEILGVHESTIPEALSYLTEEKKIIIESSPAFRTDLRTDSEAAVYPAALYVSETGIAEKIKALLRVPKQPGLINIDNVVASLQHELLIAFSERQLEAVKASLHNKIMVITGGPGTGKTTIIRAILSVAGSMSEKVILAAPTGRAAKRMAETTDHEARTIHRILEYAPLIGQAGVGFKRNESNPLDADVIIVDEVSMVDTVLMYHFLKAVPGRATLILIGDTDQLPSVGPGNVLKDLIASAILPVVRLDRIFRQSKASMIIVNAHRIRNGYMPEEEDIAGPGDFKFLAIEEPEEALRKIVSLCKEEIPGSYSLDPYRDIQVIAPMYKGTVGIANLNIALQNSLNATTDEITRNGKIFRVGDKVLQTRNNYDKDVYNGDIGLIRKIDRESQEMLCDFEGRSVMYTFSELDELVLAYAISVHKSQGSEYPVVIMPVLTQHYLLLQRNLLYTAITRGKKLVVLIGT